MAKIKDIKSTMDKIKEQTKRLKNTLASTSIYNKYGCVDLGIVKWKADIAETISNNEDLILYGPVRNTHKEK